MGPCTEGAEMNEEITHRAGFSRVVPRVAELLISTAVLAAFASATVGIIFLVQGVWPMLTGGDFAGQSLGHFLNLQEPYHKILNLDRIWWLVLIAPALLMTLVGAASDAAEWASRSPMERREAARKRREIDQRLTEKRRQKAEEAKKQKSRAKLGRGPMSGWRRLWIVLSLIIGVPVFAIAYDDASQVYISIEPNDRVKELNGQEFWNALYQQAREQYRSAKGCYRESIAMRHLYENQYSITCERSAFFDALFFAALPSFFMWLVGLTIRWVYRGFRPIKMEEDVGSRH